MSRAIHARQRQDRVSIHTAVKRGARAQFPQNFRLTKS